MSGGTSSNRPCPMGKVKGFIRINFLEVAPMAARATAAQPYREQAVLQRLGYRKADFRADSRPYLCPQPKGDVYQRDQNRNRHQWADNRAKASDDPQPNAAMATAIVSSK